MMASVALLALLGALHQAHAADERLAAGNVVWTSPSQDARGSMPIGNGDIGVNVWWEGGDLLLYLAKSDAWDEHARLIKLGRVRISTGQVLPAGASFRQELRLREGEIAIQAGTLRLRVWVDANHPAMWIEGEGDEPLPLQLRAEPWRTRTQEIAPAELAAVDRFTSASPPLVYADTIDPADPTAVIVSHANADSLYPATLTQQGLGAVLADSQDPLRDRIFGFGLQAAGLAKSDPLTMAAVRPVPRFRVCLTALTMPATAPAAWSAALQDLMRQHRALDLEQARAAHRAWWAAFWQRSWLYLDGAGQETEDVTEGWILNRWQNACAGRGAYPLKFNGSLFTVDGRHARDRAYAGFAIPAGTPYSADYRDWGGCYWFQNTRHMYWPMLAAGDYDLMLPLFRMYLDMLPLAKQRCRIYFGHDGAFFPETLYFWGAYFNDASLGYGWERAGKPVSEVDNGYTRHYWQGGIELAVMMLDYHAATADEHFASSMLLPFAREIIAFYDLHYPRVDGRLRFAPANALETFWDTVNPTPEIAGLQRLCAGMMALGDLLDEPLRSRCQRLLAELPPLPIKRKDDLPFLDAAEAIHDAKNHNGENVAMWAVFPYRAFGVGKPDLDMARHTFLTRPFRNGYGCWQNDNTSAAFLGLAEEARAHLAERFLRHGEYRFPVCWTHGDWPPDLDNGGNAAQALQAMLMQADGRSIILFPAWPRAWNVAFKLHAPMATTVAGTYRDGALSSLIVEPAARRADVTIMEPQ
jgi:alpha-L-fucosidase 2